MNIADIAKMAGVSSAAVSRYFNNGYISEEKKEAIRAVVEKTGYRPSIQAQTLRTRRTMMIGVIAPKMASYSVGSMVDGMLSTLNESNYHMVLAVTQNDPKKEIDYLKAFNDKQVDGVILIATVFTQAHRRALSQMKVPVVIVGQQLAGYNCVYHDDYHAMYDMTKQVLDSGRINPAYIGVTMQDTAVGSERYRGYYDALLDSGRSNLADRFVTADFSFKGGMQAAQRLLQKVPQMDALICATDTIALGAMEALKQNGKKVPQDICVTGQGDMEVSRLANPSLLTIHYPYSESGQLSARMLIDRLTNTDLPIQEVKLGYSLVVPQQMESA